MSNLQITLSIVGVLLIVAIVGHGFWTMRKNNKQFTQQAEKVAEKRARANASTAGFDEDGIGEVRVLKEANEANNSTQHKKTKPSTKNTSAPNHKPSVSTAEKDAADIEQMSMDLDLDESEIPLPSMRVDKDDDAEQQQQKPQSSGPVESATATYSESTSKQASTTKQTSSTQQTSTTPQMEQPQTPQQVLSLFVKGSVQGAVLLQMMTELGCKFGDMGIFHRYEQTSGNGPLIFSVANMFNPGTFDLDNIENFETEGVALFMTLPIDYDGQQAFNMMLNAAKKLAMEIPQGQVLDGRRQMLSRQSIQQAHQTIREFEKAQAEA